MPALVLMYHDLSEGDKHISPEHRPYVLEVSTFRAQMQVVSVQKTPVLTVTQWAAWPQPPRAVVITFDDGHVSNYSAALPVLLEHRLRGTFFITAGRIGSGETMNWEQLRALHAAGMEIGSHTVTHRPPSTLDDNALRYELLESRRILEDGLGSPVTAVSSPTGFFNPRMRAIAEEVGYGALCFGRVGLAADKPFSLKRIAVKRGMTEEQFKSLLQFDRRVIRRLRTVQLLRDLARKTVGPSIYIQLRRLLIRRESA